MPKLSQQRLKQLKEVLDESFFTLAGYKIILFESSADKIVRIELRETTYFLELFHKAKPQSQRGPEDTDPAGQIARFLIITERPGDFIDQHTRATPSFSDFIDELQNWTLRLQEESLVATVLEAKLEAFQEKINAELEKHVKDDSVHFSAEEKVTFHRRLAELEKKIATLEGTDGVAQEHHQKLKRVVNKLDRSLESMPKRRWLRTAASNFAVFAFKFLGTKSGQEVLSDVTQHLLK